MNDELPTAKEFFRQGWKEMLNGEIRHISELWDDIETKCVCNQKFAIGKLVHEIYKPRQLLCEKCYKFYLKVIGDDINV